MTQRLHRRRKVARIATAAACASLLAATLVAPANADPAADQALATALQSAAADGFLYEFHGQDQVFDGTRTVEVDATGKNRLRASQQGTLIVRFYTTTASNQVIIAGGGATSANAYGAILANGAGSVNKIRVDYPNGMFANLNGPAVTGAWHTFAYSVDATPGGTTARTVTSIDGSTTTQYPNYASWYNANSQINALTFLTIGGAPGALANSSNNVNFNGRIAFVAFVPDKLTQSEAADVTSGTWDGTKAFYRGDASGSGFFRIPFLLNTSSGSLIAGTDANFGSTGDSAENIDAAVRRKPNASSNGAAAGWQPAVVPSAFHMRDYADELGYKQGSASVIDGAIVQDTLTSDRIFILIDVWAWNGGIFEYLNIDQYGEAHGGRARSIALGDGFATIGSRKYLLLSSQNVKGDADGQIDNINNNTNRALFDYVADVNGPRDSAGRIRIYQLQGTPQPYSSSGTPVSDANLSLGALTAYSMDSEFVLYQNGSMLTVGQQSSQGGGPQVPMRVFYEDSVFQIYNTSYILQAYSDDDGQTWVSDKLISGMVKRENSSYYILGPGRAIQIQNGPHTGRLVVPVYYDPTSGPSSTEVIFSDDNGVTWSHGDPVPTSLGLHESALVELPDGSLQIFVRNTGSSGGKVITAASTDGGVTWRGVTSALGDTGQGINCQISTVNLVDPVVSPSTGQPRPAFVMTTAMSRSRSNGVAHVGVIHEDGLYPDGAQKYRIEWVKQYQITGTTEKFAYSSMVQLDNGKIGILYESSPNQSWADGLQAMYYREIDLADLLE